MYGILFFIMPRIAINGFGRIGRTTFKAGFEKKGFQVVAVNDLANAKTLAYLLSHDSVYGAWKKTVKPGEDFLTVEGKKIPVFAKKDPAELPWGKLRVDVVLECTGIFVTKELASQHLTAGARRVIISAPAKGGNVPTYLLGVNQQKLKGEKAAVINNASCTTNCLSPIAKMMEESFGVQKALMTTVHGYTADQELVDAPHKDVRRGRAAAINIVPTTTGAAIATTDVLPSLKGKFDGLALRVPVVTGSLCDATFLLKRPTTVEEVNQVLKIKAKEVSYRGIVEVSEEPLVSTDIISNPASAIVDLSLTRVVDGDLVKIVAWYDNEWGYAHRLAELALLAA
jgi:glyceraldehyde 3-phosphate dehydrogenase